jgi:hypothetical protein
LHADEIKANLLTFDTIGRVTNSSQQIGTGTPYTFAYNYDLSGALLTGAYPSGRTVRNAFGAAGRVSGVSGAMVAILPKSITVFP